MVKIFPVVIRVILGAFFIFSGIVKIRPIEPFEYTLVESGWVSWNFAPFVARAFISIEILLGLFCLINLKLRNTLIGIGLVLIGFTFYLLIQVFTIGNQDDCGCLGTFLAMTTEHSIYKNIVLLLLTGVIFKLHDLNSPEIPFQKYILIACFVIPFTFILRPLKYDSKAIKIDEPIDLSQIPAIHGSQDSIRYEVGQSLIVFLNPRCSHCKNAAKRIRIVDQKNEIPPVYFVFYGDEKDVMQFMTDHKVDYPFVIYKDPGFMELTQGSYPRMFFVEDGLVTKFWKGDKFADSELSSLIAN
ncbi:MAG: DoxX family membrane protein [Reichenbachiella sp.]